MNWYQDGEHVLALGGGAIIFATQCVNFWRGTVTSRRVDALHNLVADNDREILGEISTAQAALDRVIRSVSAGDRRKSAPGTPPPTWANGGMGRRATD